MPGNRPIVVWSGWAAFLLLAWAAGGAAGSAGGCHSLRIGKATVCAELAVTDAQLQRGLMGRASLPADTGMLFVYAAPRRLVFWMKNTLVPLDIGYFDAVGVLREIHPLAPLDETPVPSRSDRLRFALEVPRGWFACHGIEPGARLDLESVDAALRARGLDISVRPD